MVFDGCREPHAVINGACRLVTQNENDFLFDVDGEASEHRARPRRNWSEGVEHKFVGDWLAALGSNRICLEGREIRFADALRHALEALLMLTRCARWRRGPNGPGKRRRRRCSARNREASRADSRYDVLLHTAGKTRSSFCRKKQRRAESPP